MPKETVSTSTFELKSFSLVTHMIMLQKAMRLTREGEVNHNHAGQVVCDYQRLLPLLCSPNNKQAHNNFHALYDN